MFAPGPLGAVAPHRSDLDTPVHVATSAPTVAIQIWYQAGPKKVQQAGAKNTTRSKCKGRRDPCALKNKETTHTRRAKQVTHHRTPLAVWPVLTPVQRVRVLARQIAIIPIQTAAVGVGGGGLVTCKKLNLGVPGVTPREYI